MLANLPRRSREYFLPMRLSPWPRLPFGSAAVAWTRTAVTALKPTVTGTGPRLPGTPKPPQTAPVRFQGPKLKGVIRR